MHRNRQCLIEHTQFMSFMSLYLKYQHNRLVIVRYLIIINLLQHVTVFVSAYRVFSFRLDAKFAVDALFVVKNHNTVNTYSGPQKVKTFLGSQHL